MTDRTAAERMRRLYKRQKDEARAKGLTRRSLWCHPEDWPTIKQLAEKLAKRRSG